MKRYNKRNEIRCYKANNFNPIKEEVVRSLRIEREIRALYKKILCVNNLEDILKIIAAETINIFSLEKVAIIEEENDNYIFKQYITKDQLTNTMLTRQILYEEIMPIIKKQDKNFHSNIEDDSDRFTVWEKIKINCDFSVILSIEGRKNIVDTKRLLSFIKEILDITKNMYLKEFKYLALQKESYTDGLTKCYNRSYFELKMSELRNEENIGIIVFDLDCLKDINDKLGHEFGDNILKELVKVIKTQIDKSDIFCRYGGDEFVILATSKTEQDIKIMIKKIQASFSEINKKSFPINFSTGYSMKIKKEDSIKDTFKIADYKMYGKKIENKKNSIDKLNKYIDKHKFLKINL